jgi:hypothetical protein
LDWATVIWGNVETKANNITTSTLRMRAPADLSERES